MFEIGFVDIATVLMCVFLVFSAGLTVGAFVWGLLVDIIGRRWAFNLTVGIVAAFGELPSSSTL